MQSQHSDASTRGRLIHPQSRFAVGKSSAPKENGEFQDSNAADRLSISKLATVRE